jgi:hypothetical protein
MSVLVDTSVWSLALRRARPTDSDVVAELAALIERGLALMMGPIRQELLSGIRSPRQFETLRDHLRAFPDLALHGADYEEAATFFNRCRARGVQGSTTDLLTCAVAARRRLAIFTADQDFVAFARVLPIRLHQAHR